MKQTLFYFLSFGALSFFGCGDAAQKTTVVAQEDTACSETCVARSKNTELSCKLTSTELQRRKATVLQSMRKQMLERKELPDGYAFRFKGSDGMIDELTDFIKTERQCCDFFTFDLSISGDGSEVWLKLTGIDGTKDFITQEMEL